ncbi:sialate O-acetylesterase [Alligator sinensis]|uniref:Sialate O-acetylesterase n=1 Tax=Alligator sinensis TaxID=38654 RepID=A0A1U7SPU6_ALLSI|nr:sialate O-acetylesterase [Alligator sinensis]
MKMFQATSVIQSEVELQDVAKIDLLRSFPAAGNLGHRNFTYFSAVCWLFSHHLYETLQYPIGLPSVLWNVMIHPLLNMTLRGIIWYQGSPVQIRAHCMWGVALLSLVLVSSEANTILNMDMYSCMFPAFIADWPRAFYMGSEGHTQPLLPGKNEICLRVWWHQTADCGYTCNQRMPNIFTAVVFILWSSKDHIPNMSADTARGLINVTWTGNPAPPDGQLHI